MARIRTIKPEFFKHLELQELGINVIYRGGEILSSNYSTSPIPCQSLQLELFGEETNV